MKYLIKNKHWELNKDYNKEKLLYLLIDRPTQITTLNAFIWFNDKEQSHREYDLPAVIWNDGSVFWWKKHKPHRENSKPIYIRFDGYKEYWLKDKCIKTEHLK